MYLLIFFNEWSPGPISLHGHPPQLQSLSVIYIKVKDTYAYCLVDQNGNH